MNTPLCISYHKLFCPVLFCPCPRPLDVSSVKKGVFPCVSVFFSLLGFLCIIVGLILQHDPDPDHFENSSTSVSLKFGLIMIAWPSWWRLIKGKNEA